MGRRPEGPAARRLDLHCHSRHSKDGVPTVAELVDRALEVGLEGLALTDHDTVAGHRELKALQQAHPRLLLLPGCEVSTAQGHLLAYGVDRAPPKARPLAETLADIETQGGVAVLAHPYRWGNGVSEATVRAASGVAVEVANGRSWTAYNQRARRLAEGLDRPLTGGSDAHTLAEVGRAWTAFTRQVQNPNQALEALRRGRVSAGGRGLSLAELAGSKQRGSQRWLLRHLSQG